MRCQALWLFNAHDSDATWRQPYDVPASIAAHDAIEQCYIVNIRSVNERILRRGHQDASSPYQSCVVNIPWIGLRKTAFRQDVFDRQWSWASFLRKNATPAAIYLQLQTCDGCNLLGELQRESPRSKIHRDRPDMHRQGNQRWVIASTT